MTKTVLVVEDSPTMRNMIKVTLAGEGFECATAQDGEKALKSARETPYALIVTDINMPNMDGIEMIRQIRQDTVNKNTPILVVTTESGDAIKASAKTAGANGWIVKPFKPDVLARAAEKLAGVARAGAA
jgi:two-component system, chemotaxis family, chemotaxis protein CheY